MTAVFDTSSLMATVLDDDAPDVSVVFDEHVLDLTFYEAGNVLWKAHVLQNRTTADQHERLTDLLADLREEVVVHGLDEIGYDRVMSIATDDELTFYDAAHLACAVELEGTLVSEDGSLMEVAGDPIDVKEVGELAP